MRNICNIDLKNKTGWGSLNSGVEENEIILEFKPLPTQLTGYKVRINGTDGSTTTSKIIETVSGFVYYSVPFSYYSDAGTMQVQLLSNEGNSEYITFRNLNDLSESDNIQAKYNVDDSCFEILIIEPNTEGLPIASKTRLGAIKVGKNLSIESDGTLNSEGEQGPPGEDGKTPSFMIDENGHLIAIY